jgi:predicted DNA-binding protein (MmcQ/YjbR family)
MLRCRSFAPDLGRSVSPIQMLHDSGIRRVTQGQRVLKRLREHVLSLPETNETDSWGHPNFRAGKRTFLTFEPIRGRPTIAFRLTSAEVRKHLKPLKFTPTPYGRGLWISIEASGRLDWQLIEALTLASYKKVALKRMLRGLNV